MRFEAVRREREEQRSRPLGWFPASPRPHSLAKAACRTMTAGRLF